MPIGDLLASIEGERRPSKPPLTAPPKRKADDDLRGTASKIPRTDSPAAKPAAPGPKTDSAQKPPARPADRPYTGTSAASGSRPAVRPPVPVNQKANVPLLSKPSTTPRTTNGTINNGSKPATSKPLPTRPAPPSSDTGTARKKKRSYAEIMAMARESAPTLQSLGKIQHKPITSAAAAPTALTTSAKDKRTPGSKVGARPVPSALARGSAKEPSHASVKVSNSKFGSSSKGAATKEKTPTAEEEKKKVKKAAMATIGYTGTARPRPGARPASKPGAGSRPSSAGYDRPRPRHGASRRRYEEEDDMDDFIEYDNEESDSGPRYKYASDEESDMEAGLDELDEEETRAAMIARREDQREMELERRLKEEKLRKRGLY